MKEIPKIIHYCWFGGKNIPEEYTRYIETWKSLFPDYEIKEWNENNFDLNICDYVKKAYQAKKWAFVSDYVRFYVLYKYGGLYFDTDVEIIRSMDDLLKNGPFMGLEPTTDGKRDYSGLGFAVNPGLGLAATSGLSLYKDILDCYDSMQYGDCGADGRLKNVVSITTEILQKRGLVLENRIQAIGEIMVYPIDYFCPLHPLTGKLTITNNTFSIHHYSASWVSWETRVITYIDHKFYDKMSLVGSICKFPFRAIRGLRKLLS